MSDTSKFGFSPEILSLPNQQEYDGEAFPIALGLEVCELKQACVNGLLKTPGKSKGKPPLMERSSCAIATGDAG